MRIGKESCRQALEVMLETYTVWNDVREKASLLPVIAVLAIGAGQDGLDVPIDDDAWDEQISLTPEGEAALLADVVEGSGLPAPFDGPEWAGWEVDNLFADLAIARAVKELGYHIRIVHHSDRFQVIREGGNYVEVPCLHEAFAAAERAAKALGGWA